MSQRPSLDIRDLTELPVSAVLPEISAALEAGTRAVLSAPPGAGKTTLVPLMLLNEPWCDGRIILLEPRRLAARAAAGRMAALLGGTVGETIGYRMRLDTRISSRTRIEVVTEGVFARMVLEEPELAGVSVVIFDEFHERSLDADFGLALALDVQSGLREDLRLLVMSATLDIERVARLLDDPAVIISQGRSFPVDIRHRARAAGDRIEDAVADAITAAHASERGSILAFLPGQGEVLRTAERLEARFDADTLVVPLYGNLDQKAQDLAIQPAPQGQRKIVLATSIAETSMAFASSSTAVCRGCQSSSPRPERRDLRRCGSRARRPINGQVAPAEQNPVLPFVSGIAGRHWLSQPLPRRRFCRPTLRNWRSILRIGACATPKA